MNTQLHGNQPMGAKASKPSPLVVSDLRHSVGDLLLFDQLALRVDAGQSVAIIGESGCGKSSLLHVLAGLEPADQGDVQWGLPAGLTSLSGLKPAALAQARRRHLGLVFQAYYLMPHLSALQNVSLPYLLDNQRPDFARCQRLLNAMGLADKAERLPRQLSGGEQQRVAIARALALNPALVLADEPTGNLDEYNASQVLDVLVETCEQENAALVMVTHSSIAAARMQHCLRLANKRLETVELARN